MEKIHPSGNGLPVQAKMDRDEPEDTASKVNCYACGGGDEGCCSTSPFIKDRDCSSWWDNSFHACCFACGCLFARPWYRCASRIQGLFAPCCGRDIDRHVSEEYDFGCDSWFGDGANLTFDTNCRTVPTETDEEKKGCCSCDKPTECLVEWPGQCTRLVCFPVTEAIDLFWTVVICGGATCCCIDANKVWNGCVVPCYGCWESTQTCCVVERVAEEQGLPADIQMKEAS